MPNRNGRGPEGKGPMTGRGLGNCGNAGKTQRGEGRGLGLRRNVVDNGKTEEKN